MAVSRTTRGVREAICANGNPQVPATNSTGMDPKVPVHCVRSGAQHSPRRQATTIIEVVMAIVILSVALPPLISSFVEASNQTILPANSAVASFLVTERMEEIIARRYRATDGYAAVTTVNYPDETPVAGFPRFDRLVTVTFTDAALNTVGSDQGYKNVRVTVTWNSGANEIVIERLFADF